MLDRGGIKHFLLAWSPVVSEGIVPEARLINAECFSLCP
jgi:hypothetical protein